MTYIRRIRKKRFFVSLTSTHAGLYEPVLLVLCKKMFFFKLNYLKISPRRSPSPQFRSAFTQITQRKLDIYLFFLHAKIVCTVSHSSLNRDACDFSGLIAHINK